MSHKGFLQQFGRRFAPLAGRGLQQAGNIFLRDLLIKNRQKDRQQFLLDEREAQRQRQEQQFGEETDIISQLQRGTQKFREGGVSKGFLLPETEVPLTQENQVGLLNQLSPQGINRFNALGRILAPQQKQTIKVGNELFLESPDIKGLPIDEPIFTFPEEPRKPDRTARGFNEKGVGMNNDIFDNPDGTQTIISTPTGFFKSKNKDEIFDINTFKGSLSRFEKQFAIDNDAMDKYRFENPDLFNPETGLDLVSDRIIKKRPIQEGEFESDRFLSTPAIRINKQVDFNEQSLFNILIPQAKNFINTEYFNELKTTGRLDEPNFEYRYRTRLREGFEEDILSTYGDDNFDDIDISKINTEGMSDDQKANLKEEMNALILRQLLLWSKYKFTRL